MLKIVVLLNIFFIETEIYLFILLR